TFKKLRQIIGEGLHIPPDGRARFQTLLGEIGHIITVQSQIEVDDAHTELLEADPRPVVQLRRNGQGLTLHVALCPLGLQGPSFAPGQGPSTIVAHVEGRPLRTARDLAREKTLFQALIQACPSFPPLNGLDDEVVLPDALSAYELVTELARLDTRSVVVTWPEGDPLTLVAERKVRDLTLHFSTAGDWLSAQGSLAIDEDKVLHLSELLSLLDSAKERFIELGEGKLLALSQNLWRRLSELHALGRKKRKTIELSPMALFSIEAWIESAQRDKGDKSSTGAVTTDRKIAAQLTRLRDAERLSPEIPATLRAELRDYQREGFIWLTRLAHWGGGACLADDMGLGKTLQALALLLHRAEEGPALVVAPTSVCSGWIAEATRFCPTLRPLRYGEGNRAEMLDDLRPYDMLIVSYGLLVHDIESLAKPLFATAILDEAQAIKNA
ncbi:MAG: ATP-dependent helicase, partial [Deltaproteobacteria bacterium]|nr:ATP-dependent helicase [Deltaproteobacteria bacterium]